MKLLSLISSRLRAFAVQHLAVHAANEATPSETDQISAVNEHAVTADKWVVLSPYGDFDNKVGMQRFQRADAENVVNEFHSLRSLPTRVLGLPFYIGHPDHEAFKDKYRDTRAYGRIKELRATDTGLEARVKWSPAGEQLIADEAFHGHSVNWAMRRDGNVLRPFRLKSVGFTNEPNIPVPPVTAANETPGADPLIMNKTKVIAWLKKLGIEVANEATEQELEAALGKAEERITTAANEVATEKGKAADLAAKLTAAESKASAALVAVANERAAHDKLVFDAAVKEGRITKAERPALEVEAANESTRAAALQKVAAAKPKLHTTARTDGLGQRNAGTRDRMEAIETAVNERMTKDKCDRTQAFIRLRKDGHELFVQATN